MKKQPNANGIAMPQLKTTDSNFRRFRNAEIPALQLRLLKGGNDAADGIIEIDIIDH